MGLGWKGWTRERLPAEQLQGYLQDQVVQDYSTRAVRTASGPAVLTDGMASFIDAEGVPELVRGGAWSPWSPTASGRVPFTNVDSIAADSGITGVITLPAFPAPVRVVAQAIGRAGFGAAARTIMWDFDSTPVSATGLGDDHNDQPALVTVASGVWAALGVSMGMTLPAGVAPTFRLVMRANGAAYNRGAVIWHRSPVVTTTMT